MNGKYLKFFLVLVITFFVTLFVALGASAATLSISQLQSKFPHGKYWNHASGTSNNQDGYTSTPCNHKSSKDTCNHFELNGKWYSSQCMGFAEKLGYDYTGYNPRLNSNGWKTYTDKSALDNLKTGDIVRYNTSSSGHSIFITDVSGDNVVYADCNGSNGNTCNIRWNVTTSISQLKNKSIQHVRSAPYPTVKFDGNGLSYSSSRKVELHEPVGSLPVITRVGYKLDGWYTAAKGGTKISSSTKITKNVTFYAHWTEQLQDVTSTYKNKKITIKSVQNSRYLSFVSKTDTILYALAKTASTWETFTTSASGEWLGFKAYNGKYLSATATKDRIQASASKLSTWECFKIFQKGSNLYIKSRKNSKFLTVFVDEKNAPVRAYQKNESSWERFEIKVQ